MSISNIDGMSIRNELRRLQKRVAELEAMNSRIVQQGNIVSSHASLTDLDFASSGHTGFASDADLTAHTGDTANPHSVTLDQACEAGNITDVNEVTFNGGAIAGRVGAIKRTSAATDAPLIFNNSAAGGADTAFWFETATYTDDLMRLTAEGSVFLTMKGTVADRGEIWRNDDETDQFIHEQMTQVEPTGNWNVGGIWDFDSGSNWTSNASTVPGVGLGSFMQLETSTAAQVGQEATASHVRVWFETDRFRYSSPGVTEADVNSVQGLNEFDQGTDLTTADTLNLHGKASGLPASKSGGEIAWYDNADALACSLKYTTAGTGLFELRDSTATAVWSIDIDDGAVVNTGDFTLQGENFNWTLAASGVGPQWAPTHDNTGTPTAGDNSFGISPKGELTGGLQDTIGVLGCRIRDPAASPNDKSEWVFSVSDGSGAAPVAHLAVVGDTNPSVELRDGTRLAFDGTPTNTFTAVTTQGDTYFVMNGTSLELYVQGTLEQTWTSGGGGGGGDSYLEWAGL